MADTEPPRPAPSNGKHPLSKAAPGCALCKLEPKLRKRILLCLDSLADIVSGLRATRCLHSLLNVGGGEAEIADAFLRRQIHPAVPTVQQNLHENNAAKDASLSPGFRHSRLMTRTDMRLRQSPVKAIKLKDMPRVINAHLLQTRILAVFASSYVRTKREITQSKHGMPPSVPIPKCILQPSDTEMHRIAFSLCQVDSYLTHMSHSTSQKDLGWAETMAARFFGGMTPWEKEQFVSILEALTLYVQRDLFYLNLGNPLFGDFMDEMWYRLELDPKLDILRAHELEAPHDRPLPDIRQNIFVRLVSFAPLSELGRAITTKDNPTRIELYKHLFRRPVPWSVVLEHFVHQPEEGHSTTHTAAYMEQRSKNLYRQLVKPDRDLDPGPRRAWMAFNKAAVPPYWVALDTKAPMRLAGYVFWDGERDAEAWFRGKRRENRRLVKVKPFAKFPAFRLLHVEGVD